MRRAAFLLSLSALPALAQTPLQQQIRTIAAEARGKVSVACALPGSALNCDLNPHAHPPMQSVFKLPLGVAILMAVEQRRFTLDQPIRFRPEDRILPETYSALQDKYPNANVDIPLRELLHLAVEQSDNVAADILLRLAGGPGLVNASIASLGILGFHLADGEDILARDQQAQYRNWFEPVGAVQLLRLLHDHSPLTPEHSVLLRGWMQNAVHNVRLKGGLPPGTVVAHRSGTSGSAGGLIPATNDIGLIMLPDGRQLAIAVFVTDALARQEVCEKVVSKIGYVAYDAALQPTAH